MVTSVVSRCMKLPTLNRHKNGDKYSFSLRETAYSKPA